MALKASRGFFIAFRWSFAAGFASVRLIRIKETLGLPGLA